ncbi:MAG TPA: DUF3168 domain-containing protein [Sedimentisphaerales bacterium]|nr:DUF3168 domain-containing protein [Sedimentisphaerales bacterium]
MANVEQAIVSILANDATVGPLLSPHGLNDTDTVQFYSSTTLPDPLAVGTTYYVRDKTANTFKVAYASGGAAINLTDAGVGTHWVRFGPKFRTSLIITADAATEFCTVASYRIYPMIVPQGAPLPAVTYQRISGPRFDDLLLPGSLASPTFQLNSWAAAYPEAKALGDAVQAAMNVYYTGGVVAGVTIGSVTMLDDGDLPDLSPSAEERERYAIRQDWQIIHKE